MSGAVSEYVCAVLCELTYADTCISEVGVFLAQTARCSAFFFFSHPQVASALIVIG